MNQTTVEAESIQNPVPVPIAKAAESQEPSPEKVDERYLALLRQRAEEIKTQVFSAHGIDDLNAAPRDERERAIIDLNTTIINFLEAEHRKLLEAEEETKGPAFKSFIEESRDWYAHNLDRPNRLGMFAAMAGGGEAQGSKTFEPTIEVVQETSGEMRARLMETSHNTVPIKSKFLASALGYFEAHETGPKMVTVGDGDSVWKILSKALENERPN